jgi:hypothetical protein
MLQRGIPIVGMEQFKQAWLVSGDDLQQVVRLVTEKLAVSTRAVRARRTGWMTNSCAEKVSYSS